MTAAARPVMAAGRLAEVARMRRAEITAAMAAEPPGGPLHRLAARLGHLHPDADLADVCAQLLAYRPVTRGAADGVPPYDEFLARYDPARRAATGAVYTPPAVVGHMVRTVDDILRHRFGLDGGVADPTSWERVARRLEVPVPAGADPAAGFVTVVDPAIGTGAYLVEWIRRARRSCGEDGWPERLARTVVPALHGVELLPVPALLARSQLVAELAAQGHPGGAVTVTVGDALAAAAAVPAGRPVTVVIGNPPYGRVARHAGGGIVTAPGADGRCLLDDVLGPAAEDTVFSHHASIYNRYVYFWRWALAQVFEPDPAGVGVVSLVTASSWLTGPGFVGLRQLARELADEIWVVDLGGDNKGARPEENVFDIESPVAVITLAAYRRRRRDRPAWVHYRRLRGTRADKLDQLAGLDPLAPPTPGAAVPSRWRAPLVPSAGGGCWDAYPALTDLFPWQQPGCKYGRTWPVAPDRGTLLARWEHLMATDDPDERARRFATTRYGRRITTRVDGAEPLVDLPVGAPPPPIVAYAYRSFDRQWALADPRLARTESPSLWAAQGPGQLYLVTKPTMRLGAGPAAVVTTAVPDLDSFRGSFGGKDVVPLYRNHVSQPNVAPGALAALTDAHQARDRSAPDVSAEDLFAYAYALLAGADYTDRFAAELDTPGVRLPLTTDPALFAEAAGYGRWLIGLHTGEPHPPGAVAGLQWDPEPSCLPAGPRGVAFDGAHRSLRVADGVLHGVDPAAWGFSVSGMVVVKKWLGYRSALGAGRSRRSGSPLDRIRPSSWPPEWSAELARLIRKLAETAAAQPRGARLLAAITAGPLLPATDLPPVPDPARKPPAVTAGSLFTPERCKSTHPGTSEGKLRPSARGRPAVKGAGP